ncbi:hypothetical protein BURK1_03332 [Burkholderiales bacterium]|nr:hypothetical protein BURK1_03332 [Burkholderiales bacterium]
MKHHITKQGDRLLVRIDDVSGQEPALLLRIRQCRQSAWSCPSGECMKIGSIDEHVDGGGIELTLTPRPGVQLDVSGIDECLGYMLREVDSR